MEYESYESYEYLRRPVGDPRQHGNALTSAVW